MVAAVELRATGQQVFGEPVQRLLQHAIGHGEAGLAFVSDDIVWSGPFTTNRGDDVMTLDTVISVMANPGAYTQNQKDLESAGHWGVPTTVFNGEPFFGQDRLDLLVWRMKQHGLQPR